MIISGKELNADTLQTFFTFHTAVFPFLLLVLVLYHFWRVRKAGGVLIPETDEKSEMVPAMPNLVFKEFIVALVLIAVLFTFAALFNAPLLEKANPSYSMNPTKAPWYFAGVQELLMHFHPFFAAFIIPISVVVFLAWIPFLKYDEAPNGHWFISEKGRKSSEATAKFAAIVTLAGILFNEYVLNFEVLLSPVPAFISNGILPLADPAWFYGRILQVLPEETQSFESRIGAGSFRVYNCGIYCAYLDWDIFQGKRYGVDFPVECIEVNNGFE